MSLITAGERDLVEYEAFCAVKALVTNLHTLALTPGVDPELQLKMLNSKLSDIGKVIPEKKLDPYAGLPMVTVNFINGAMQATVTMPTLDADVVSTVQAELDAVGFSPSAPMLSSLHINVDLEGLVDA